MFDLLVRSTDFPRSMAWMVHMGVKCVSSQTIWATLVAKETESSGLALCSSWWLGEQLVEIFCFKLGKVRKSQSVLGTTVRTWKDMDHLVVRSITCTSVASLHQSPLKTQTLHVWYICLH